MLNIDKQKFSSLYKSIISSELKDAFCFFDIERILVIEI